MTAVVQRPTVPGYAEGIVSVDPLVQQCRDCGVTRTSPDRDPRGRAVSIAFEIIRGGFRFHTCEGRTGVRRCPTCHAAALAACDRPHD